MTGAKRYQRQCVDTERPLRSSIFAITLAFGLDRRTYAHYVVLGGIPLRAPSLLAIRQVTVFLAQENAQKALEAA